ncbi:MAG: protein kinase domain-containing protein [Terriglobales bacterium]
MALTPGTKLGPYEIQSPLGAGGMGEVYRARDARLGRDVALKILPEALTRDTDRLHRFEQEARAVAALNHPNILAVFDLGQHNGSPYLVSELLEGETLRAALDRGALPQRKSIEYGVQIAHGLAAAHDKNIVHRDLKPENVFITRDARIKILDFGLAKLAQTAVASRPESDAVTLASSRTAVGVVMGTASYMAPEQVRAEAADARTDIFAFGAVLYEMLSGARAFRRDTTAETMTAVLKEDPPELSSSGQLVSPALDRIVRRCLEKNPEQRFQSARDLSFALGSLSGTDASGAIRATSAPRRVPLMLWLPIALAIVTASALTWWIARRPPTRVDVQFAIPVDGEVTDIALSRDGSMLAFVSPDQDSGLPMLYVQRVGSSVVTMLPGTHNASFPFWSPNASYIAFFADGKLEKSLVSGGTPEVLASVQIARGGTWGRRDVIVYSPDAGGELWRVNADGSGAAPLTGVMLKGEDSNRWPVFLPDGNHFLFWGGNFGDIKTDHTTGIYVSSLDSKERKLVILEHSSFGYDSGHLYFADDQSQLVSVAFDPSAARVSGSTTAIRNFVGFQPSTYWAALAVADNGTVIYDANPSALVSALTWMDRTGKQLGRVGDPAVMANPTLSPDDSRVALDITDQKANNVDVWIENANAAGNTRLTFDPAEEAVPVWSRDGKTLAYRSNFSGGSVLLLKQANGLEAAKQRLQVTGADDIVPNSWSADDRQILFTHFVVGRSYLDLVPVTDGGPTRFLSSKSSVTNGMISPDGKWVAYASDETGNWEIYVTTFPGATGKWQVSRGGGTQPRWRGDGREIFYVSPGGVFMSVAASYDGGFSTGIPTPLFPVHARAPISSTDVYAYDVAKDGKRFLVNRYIKPEHVAPLTILLRVPAATAAP